MVPSDNGKVAWWSQDGDKTEEFESFMQDYVVRMDWSTSGEGLWLCGFSCILYLAVERNGAGKVEVGVVSSCGLSCCTAYPPAFGH